MIEMTMQEALDIIDQLQRQIKCWTYLFEEEQKIAVGFRDLAYKYKELADQAPPKEKLEVN